MAACGLRRVGHKMSDLKPPGFREVLNREFWKNLTSPFAITHSHTRICIPACVLSRFSRVQLFVPLLTVACQTPLSMGLSRQESWRGCCVCILKDVANPFWKRWVYLHSLQCPCRRSQASV